MSWNSLWARAGRDKCSGREETLRRDREKLIMKDRPGLMTLTVLVALAIRLTGTAFAAEQLTGSDAYAGRVSRRS